MIKIVFCLRRKPSIARGVLSLLAGKPRTAGTSTRARATDSPLYTGAYVPDPRIDPAVDARGCEVQPYDGVAEVHWDDIGGLVDAFSTEEGQAAGMALLADEQTFIDLPNSSLFFAEEHEIVPG